MSLSKRALHWRAFFFDLDKFSPWPLSFVIVSFQHLLERGTQACVRHSHCLTLKGYNA